MAEERYLLDNQQTQAGQRFDALAEIFNPSTFRHMQSVGLSPGWRVWEVGAGGESVPEWISEQTHGYVLATDIDTSWLNREGCGFEVRNHDIGTDPAPDDGFDLVHARLVLVHVRARFDALTTMVSALKPGRWLLLEEADPGLQPLVCPDEYGVEQQLANKLKMAFRSLMADRGVDLSFGRKLPAIAQIGGPCRRAGGRRSSPWADRLVTSSSVQRSNRSESVSSGQGWPPRTRSSSTCPTSLPEHSTLQPRPWCRRGDGSLK